MTITKSKNNHRVLNLLIMIYGKNLEGVTRLEICFIVCIQRKKNLKYTIHQ